MTATTPGSPTRPLASAIDHVIVGVVPAALSTTHPLVVVSPGGDHEGLGTTNALARLRNAYIELIAVRDRGEAESSWLMAPLATRLAECSAGWIGMALRIDDAAEAARRLDAFGVGSRVLPGRRRGGDGSLVSWQMVFAGTPPWGGPRPFAIVWDQSPPLDPGSALELDGVEVEAPDPDAEAALYRDVFDAAARPTGDGGWEVDVGDQRIVIGTGDRGLCGAVLRPAAGAPAPPPGETAAPEAAWRGGRRRQVADLPGGASLWITATEG